MTNRERARAVAELELVAWSPAILPTLRAAVLDMLTTTIEHALDEAFAPDVTITVVEPTSTSKR